MPPSPIREADPESTWAALRSGARKTVLIDVRTTAEWSFVGLPDLSETGSEPVLIEWQSFPTMAANPTFAETALAAIDERGAEEAYFLCRSGARSLHAAQAVSEAADAASRSLTCVNVAEGFEGDRNAEGRRGALNGWKASGLPWRQG